MRRSSVSHMGKSEACLSTNNPERTRGGSLVDCERRTRSEKPSVEPLRPTRESSHARKREVDRKRPDGEGASLSPRSNGAGSECSTRSCESHEKVGRTLSGESTGKDGASPARPVGTARRRSNEEEREVRGEVREVREDQTGLRAKRGKGEAVRGDRVSGSPCTTVATVSPVGTARRSHSGSQSSDKRPGAKQPPLHKVGSSSSSLSKTMAPTVMNTPTRIEAGRQKFLIFDAPSQENLPAYIEEMRAYEVTDLVCTCERTYDDKTVLASGIRPHEMIFPDGEAPPDDVIDDWLTLCNSVSQQKGAIAVHCVAGLGRAPVLVAIALIEKGMDPMDAIMFIRERRKGAINRRQLQFLKGYKRRSHYKKCCGGGCKLM